MHRLLSDRTPTRRAVKYVVNGAVLAAVVGSAVAWTTVDKTVTLEVDGQAKQIHTVANTVDGVLHGAGYTVGQHDLVAPDLNSPAKDDATVVLRRGRLLHLTVDGVETDVWTTALTVQDALAELGYSSADATSVSRSTRLPLSATGIEIRSPKSVTVVHDGRTDVVSTTAGTVSELLTDLGVSIAAGDTVSVPLAGAPTAGEQIVVQHVVHKQETESQPVPFPTQTQDDPGMVSGQTQVVQPGAAGTDTVVYDAVYVDGKLIGRTQVSRTTVTPPTPQIIHKGTGSPPPDDVANNQAIARAMLPQFGFSDDQMSCLITLWNHESGWRATARNPNGGAYGIPQALPGNKMASAGANWQTDPRVQIAWGLGYIKAGYGTPCGAWSTWQAHGGWY